MLDDEDDLLPEPQVTKPASTENQEPVEEVIPEPEPPPRRSTRDRRQVDRFLPGTGGSSASTEPVILASETKRAQAEPKSYKMAMKSPEADKWKEACAKEIKNIMDMGVWEIVDRPKNAPVVGGRWHFKLKLNPNGTVNKYKARYVAKGFTQTEGVDYNDTFAPTGRLASFRILVAIAAAKGWDIEQMDAIAAFLNSDLKEEIYLELPEGYDSERANGKVAKLQKALYGLKQSARCWNDEVKDKFKEMKLKQNPHDACLWYRKTEGGKETLIYLHVDDMAITGDEVEDIKSALKLKWRMEDLGPAHCVVGIEINSLAGGGYSLNQAAMIQTVLERFQIEDSKPASTPFPGGTKIGRASDAEAQEFRDTKLP